MAISPQFLEELRARLPLADIVGRRVTLRRAGREHSGLCPFHNEKTPSFTVSEEKGFYHCFGCGAHGDVIGFVMRTEGLSFPEAVERLAAEAGLEVPRSTPAERQRAERAGGLLRAMEAACAWYESTLAGADGAAARAYLAARDLDEATIARFRLGFAPDRRGGLKAALTARGIGEDTLIEAGLLTRPAEGGLAYDRFRGRIIFPITDRRGRVIAFGGRILDADATTRDGRPLAKYLNSPETPLFHKGQVLYALDKAQAAAHDGEAIVVTEGYTDVIALHKAGFGGAVAPLGTALTEGQIELLWRLAPEPVLCFDGDTAGRRAAARAAERALPLLRPGYSLRFAMLPQGEDPDSLIRDLGVEAMRALLARARPLVDQLWAMVAEGTPADTPERRAGIRQRLRGHAFEIAERSVQQFYLDEFESRLRAVFAPPRREFSRRRPGTGRWSATGRDGAWPESAMRADFNVDILALRQQQVLLATVLNHPALLADVGEALGALRLHAPELDRLRQEIIKSLESNLDSVALRNHLREQGFSAAVDRLLSEEVYEHGVFARPGAALEEASKGWRQLFERFHRRRENERALVDARRALAEEPTDRNRARLDSLREQQLRTDESEWGDSEEGGGASRRLPDG